MESTERKSVGVLAGNNVVYGFGEQLKEYEWDSKSVQNLLYAIYERQCGASIGPDPDHVEKFTEMSQRLIKDRIHLFRLVFDPRKAYGDYIEK